MPKKYQLHLKGYVGGWDFDRDYVDYVLNQNTGKPVNVLIDSLGGGVAEALSISSAFRNHGDVSVHYVGMNASAATIASMGAKHVSIDASAMYLVHQCSQGFFEWGAKNATQLTELIEKCRKQVADLEKIDQNIASMYAGRCKKTAAELLGLMKIGGWLTAKEALEWGFVDEITDNPDDVALPVTDDVYAAMSAAGMPLPKNAHTDRESSVIRRFIASVGNMLKSQHTNIKHNMEKTFTLICAALSLPSLTAADDGSYKVTAEQMQSLENLFKQRKDEVDRLTADIAERDKTIDGLKAAASSTTQVVEPKKTAEEKQKSELEQFHDSMSAARDIYKNLP